MEEQPPAESIVGEQAAQVMAKVVGMMLGVMARHGRFVEHKTLVAELTAQEINELEEALDAAELIMLARGMDIPPEVRATVDSARRLIKLGKAKGT